MQISSVFATIDTTNLDTMKKLCLLLLILTSHHLFSQTPGFLFGDGVRIRSTGSTKGKEVSKLYGLYEVLILEVSSQPDGLGKTDNPCEMFPWVKIKWHPDSTGWVYGKYIYHESEENTIKEGLSFDVGGDQCTLKAVLNYGAPSSDENEGLTGCDQEYLILVFNPGDLSFTPIKDSKSKEGETYMKLFSGEGGGEQITATDNENSNIVLYTQIYLQDGGSQGVYTIKRTGSKYEVINYQKNQQ